MSKEGVGSPVVPACVRPFTSRSGLGLPTGRGPTLAFVPLPRPPQSPSPTGPTVVRPEGQPVAVELAHGRTETHQDDWTLMGSGLGGKATPLDASRPQLKSSDAKPIANRPPTGKSPDKEYLRDRFLAQLPPTEDLLDKFNEQQGFPTGTPLVYTGVGVPLAYRRGG